MKPMFIEGAYPKPMNQLRLVQDLRNTANAASTGSIKGPAFADYLTEQVNKVNSTIVTADQKVADVTTGKSKNLHEMMVALNKADLSLRMLTSVRNKAVEAYQEIMRMSL
jgi:flagellar hook-basal body complex protein FliE